MMAGNIKHTGEEEAVTYSLVSVEKAYAVSYTHLTLPTTTRV